MHATLRLWVVLVSFVMWLPCGYSADARVESHGFATGQNVNGLHGTYGNVRVDSVDECRGILNAYGSTILDIRPIEVSGSATLVCFPSGTGAIFSHEFAFYVRDSINLETLSAYIDAIDKSVFGPLTVNVRPISKVHLEHETRAVWIDERNTFHRIGETPNNVLEFEDSVSAFSYSETVQSVLDSGSESTLEFIGSAFGEEQRIRFRSRLLVRANVVHWLGQPVFEFSEGDRFTVGLPLVALTFCHGGRAPCLP